MNDEIASVDNQIGLYQDPASGQFIGLIDPIQADAAIRAGWVLHTAGREAAMSSQEDIDALKDLGKVTHEPAEDKKGKK